MSTQGRNRGRNNNYLKLFVHIIPRKNGSKPILKVLYPRNKGTDTGKCWVTGFKLHKKAWMGVQFETWRGFTLHIYCICILCKFQHKSVKYIIVGVYCTQPTCTVNPTKEYFLTTFMETLPRESEPNSFSPPDTLWIWKAGWESVVQHQKVQGDLWWNLICKSIQFATLC